MRLPEFIPQHPSIAACLLAVLASLGSGLVALAYLVSAFRNVRAGVSGRDAMRALRSIRPSPAIEQAFQGAGVEHARRSVTWMRVQITLLLIAFLVFGYIRLRGY